jgi:hypothetical protein
MRREDRDEQAHRPPAAGRQHLLAVLILALLGLVGYGQLLIPGQLPFFPDSNIATYHLGTREVLARAPAADRGIPFWQGDQLAGTPP